jgi:pectinesterase
MIGILLAAAAVASSPSTTQSSSPNSAIVAADGSGQFKTVQAAIDAAPQITESGSTPFVIHVKPGVYEELVYIQREKRFIALVGEDPAKTTIRFGLYGPMKNVDGKPIGTFRSPTVQIDADDFTVANLTIENTAGPKGQALALRADGDRVAFRNCRFVGWQDTVFLNRGRQYFQDCEVTGATDFIFGGATAFFDHCKIHIAGNGYIAAPSTPDFQQYGFVFDRCSISGDKPDVKTLLGRPWRAHGNAVFMNCEMSDVVRPVGWDNWRSPQREKTARFAEFNSSGRGGSSDQRAAWATQLSETEAKEYSMEKVLDRWDPKRQLDESQRVDAR